MNAKMRNLIKDAAGWIHATILLSIVFPVLYAMGMDRVASVENTVHVRSLIIAVPVILSGIAIKKCKTIWKFIVSCLVMICLTIMLAILVSPFGLKDHLTKGYVSLVAAETLIIMVLRLADRLSQKKSEKDNMVKNPYWQPQHYLLNRPSITGVPILALVYFFCRDFDSESVCNIALISSIIYFIDYVVYKYIEKTDEYLQANKDIKNVPAKRVRGIGNITVAFLAAAILIVAVPSILTIGLRQYRDYRQWAAAQEGDYEELSSYFTQNYNGEDPEREAIEEIGNPTKMPEIINAMIYIAGIAIALYFAVKVIKMIRDNISAFKETYDDNGDLVEELQESDDLGKRHFRKSKAAGEEIGSIRKRYKKYIMSHLKVVPEKSDTPLQIEKRAQVYGTKECQSIHSEYEAYRYGKIGENS